jgi:hypothetical protein
MMIHEISDSPADEHAGSVGYPLRPMVTVAVGDLPAWFGVCAGVIHDRLGRTGVEHRCGVSIWARNGDATARVSDGCEDAAGRGQHQDDEIGDVDPSRRVDRLTRGRRVLGCHRAHRRQHAAVRS